MDFFCEMAELQNCLFFKYKDEYQKFKWNVEFSYLSFDPSLSSENAKTTTFSPKN